ncbi:MAG TPA: MFS transporter [Steroidobacteraceae bacterium]|nr:MFS transporter [Steroidobacteraceae bacterium]
MSAGPAAARLLARAVDLRPGEAPGLLAAFAYHFLLFTGYYILRPIRDSMGVTGGVENLDEQFGWVLLSMLAIVPLFGWISGRFRRAVFLPWTYLFFVVQLVAFWVVFNAREDDAATARVFFVWVSVINLPLISVFWSFMADLFDREQGKRLFAFITAGASVGAMSGSAITAFLAKAAGEVNLLLVSAAMIAATIFLMRYLLRWSAGREARGERAEARPIGGNPFAGLWKVLSTPYLGGIAVFIFLMAGVNTVLYVQQAGLLEVNFPDRDARTAFLGRIELVMSVTTLLLQFFAVGRLTQRAGVAAMIVVVPLFVAAGFLLISASPTLMTLVAVFIARRVGQYAIVRPCREMLYTTVDRESKYKAKNVNDTLVYRTSDWVFAKAQVWIESAFQASLSGMALFGAGIAAAWAAVAWLLGRAHERKGH